jgi:hypothetical protein
MQLGDRWYIIERSHRLRKSVAFTNFPIEIQYEQVENRNLDLQFQFLIVLEIISFIFVSESPSITDCDSTINDIHGGLLIRSNRFDYLSLKTFLFDGIDLSLVEAPVCSTGQTHLSNY